MWTLICNPSYDSKVQILTKKLSMASRANIYKISLTRYMGMAALQYEHKYESWVRLDAKIPYHRIRIYASASLFASIVDCLKENLPYVMLLILNLLSSFIRVNYCLSSKCYHEFRRDNWFANSFDESQGGQQRRNKRTRVRKWLVVTAQKSGWCVPHKSTL